MLKNSHEEKLRVSRLEAATAKAKWEELQAQAESQQREHEDVIQKIESKNLEIAHAKYKLEESKTDQQVYESIERTPRPQRPLGKDSGVTYEDLKEMVKDVVVNRESIRELTPRTCLRVLVCLCFLGVDIDTDLVNREKAYPATLRAKVLYLLTQRERQIGYELARAAQAVDDEDMRDDSSWDSDTNGGDIEPERNAKRSFENVDLDEEDLQGNKKWKTVVEIREDLPTVQESGMNHGSADSSRDGMEAGHELTFAITNTTSVMNLLLAGMEGTGSVATGNEVGTNILVKICQYLDILECRKFVMTCGSLWRNRSLIEEKRSANVVLRTLADQDVFEQIRPQNLLHLDLGTFSEDDYLKRFDWSTEFPNLRAIAMEESMVTSEGLRSLYHHPSLFHVNVSFCDKVGYLDAVQLRDNLQSGAVVQRLPREMQGQQAVEGDLYCFWPDGMYTANGHEDFFGFVKPIERDGPRIMAELKLCMLTGDGPHVDGIHRRVELLSSKLKFLFLEDGSGQYVMSSSKSNYSPDRLPTVEHSALELGRPLFFDGNGNAHLTANDSSRYFIIRTQNHALDMQSPPEEVLNLVRQTIIPAMTTAGEIP